VSAPRILPHLLGSLPVRIPSGDLAPVRKRRRYGKRRNPLPLVLGVLLIAAIAIGGYVLQREDDRAGQVTQAVRCPSPAPVASAAPAKPVVLPAPAGVAVTLLNGTPRSGLARAVGNELARRGFRVSGMGNAPAALTGGSVIAFGPGGRPAATLLSAHVIGGQLLPVAKAPAGSVTVTLGSTFVRLRKPAEVSAYTRDLGKPAAVPRPAPTRSCG
jgi:hypothetical protein